MGRNIKSHSYNIVMNSMVGVMATIIQVLLNYAVRIVLVKQLGAEINGLHNLFQNIANVMALLETGFGTALIVHLYRPVAEHNENEILKLMYFFRRVYLTIGLAFLCICIFIDVVFLQALIDTTIEFNKVRIYFFIFMLSFVFNYFTYYKRSILFAEQKNRVSIFVTLICEMVFRVAEIIVLIAMNSYYVFLILMILEKLSANLICNHYVNREFPFLRKHREIGVDHDTKQSIYDQVKPLLVYNVSSTVQQSSKSILISSLLGNIKNVGYFGNYQLVVSAAQLLFSQFGGAFTSAFGNISVKEDSEEMYNAYSKFTFILNWIAIVLCAGFVACIQDFILFTFGSDYLLPFSFVNILALDMFLYLLTIPLISIQNAMGLHGLDKWYMVIQTLLSLLFGYVGGKLFSLNGIFIGLMIPYFIFTVIHKGYIIFSMVFDMKGKSYCVFLIKEIMKCLLVVLFNSYCCHFIMFESVFMTLLVKAVVTVLISGLLFVIFSFRNKYFKYYVGLFFKSK